MKHYLIVSDFDGFVEHFTCQADDKEHAIEQMEDASTEFNASQYITHIFVSDSPIMNVEAV